MDAEQLTALHGFAYYGKAATYDAGAGLIDCKVVFDQQVDQFAEDRLAVPRVELSLLVSEIGEHVPGAVITLQGKTYDVRNLVEDDGVVRRVVVEL